MTMRMKMVCDGKQVTAGGTTISLTAVYSRDPGHPNKAWSEATPNGRLTAFISAGNAADGMKVGSEYYIDIVDAQVVDAANELGTTAAAVEALRHPELSTGELKANAEAMGGRDAGQP